MTASILSFADVFTSNRPRVFIENDIEMQEDIRHHIQRKIHYGIEDEFVSVSTKWDDLFPVVITGAYLDIHRPQLTDALTTPSVDVFSWTAFIDTGESTLYHSLYIVGKYNVEGLRYFNLLECDPDMRRTLSGYKRELKPLLRKNEMYFLTDDGFRFVRFTF